MRYPLPVSETFQRSPVFATTRWSMVLRIGDSSDERAEALAQLCRNYWFPLYAYARRRGNSPEDSEDLTQTFVARLLESADFSELIPNRGKFRSFLLTSFQRFMVDEWRKEQSQKRGGASADFSMDADEFEERLAAVPGSEDDPEYAFDRSWAVSLVDRVYEELANEYERAGKSELYRHLRECLLGGTDRIYADYADELGMSEGGFTMAVHRLRRRFGDEIRGEVAHTVSDESEVDEEVRWLLTVIGRET